MMKTIALTLVAAWISFAAGAAEVTWGTDLPEAQAKAKAENKMVLLDFTGSDWCGWCMKFHKEALDTDAFKNYAAKNLELVVVDFPQKKEQSAELKKANAALKTKYGVKGFPTYIVLDSQGKEIGRQVGYSSGGPEAFTAKLEKFRKNS